MKRKIKELYNVGYIDCNAAGFSLYRDIKSLLLGDRTIHIDIYDEDPYLLNRKKICLYYRTGIGVLRPILALGLIGLLVYLGVTFIPNKFTGALLGVLVSFGISSLIEKNIPLDGESKLVGDCQKISDEIKRIGQPKTGKTK